MLKNSHIPDDANELIKELEQSTPESVKNLRAHARISVRVQVTVQPASLSERDGVRLQGVTGDVSSGGTQILLARPLRIGDLYQLTFDRAELDIPPAFAICLRARMVRSDAFEAGLKFLSPVELPSASPSTPVASVI